MELVARLGVFAPEREIVALVQALQQLAGARNTRQLADIPRGHLAEQRARGEHALRLDVEGREDLAGEVIEQHLVGRAPRQMLRVVEPGLQQEHQSADPALRPLA